ncbi:F-box protein At5g03100-like isoform X1 [Phoenix dactylifera]|uniref:F-box protein At5g03100-like isoform X1 n=2 Tax=Phoenix dactylifera TaxID=42345 RepID=A0A8B7MXL2_PHODC|nr:F-box protein At5g03100-like isoform X1 [Phoenix dactylifera]
MYISFCSFLHITSSKEEEKTMGVSEDRISSLPDTLLHNILSRMPTKMAVRTSALARRWRHLWKAVPVLDLDEGIWEYLKRKKYPNGEDRVDLMTRDYVRFVDQFLRQHNGPVIRTLKIRVAVDGRRSLVKRWIRTALEKQVEELHFGFQGEERFELPSYMLNSRSMTSLRLSFCWMRNSLSFRRLPNLRILYLKWVAIGDAQFPKILRECRHLESMHLDGCLLIDNIKIITLNPAFKNFTASKCDILSCIEIDAPHLRSFHYTGHQINFYMKDITMLRDAFIDITGKYKTERTRTILLSPSNVEVLTMQAQLLEGLLREKCKSENELDTVWFPNLKEIQLQMGYVCPENIVALSWLMSISPSVERIFVTCHPETRLAAASKRPPILKLFDIASMHPVFLRIAGFTGLPYEKLLLRYFLTKAEAPVTLFPVAPHGFWLDQSIEEIIEVDTKCRGQSRYLIQLLKQLPMTCGKPKLETPQDNEGIENILPMHRDF